MYNFQKESTGKVCLLSWKIAGKQLFLWKITKKSFLVENPEFRHYFKLINHYLN